MLSTRIAKNSHLIMEQTTMTRVTKEVTALFLSSLNKQGEDVEKLEKEMDQVIIKTIC